MCKWLHYNYNVHEIWCIRQNQTNTTSIIYSHTTVLLVSSLNLGLSTWGLLLQRWIHGDVKHQNGGSRHWQVPGLAISSVAACFSSSNVHSVDFASYQPLRSRHNLPWLVFGLHWCPTTILNYNLFPPVHPSPPTQCKHPWNYLARSTSQIFLYFLVKTSVSSSYC